MGRELREGLGRADDVVVGQNGLSGYLFQRHTPSGVSGGLGGLGGSFGFGGLIRDGRILGALGFGSGTAIRFQGMAVSSSCWVTSVFPRQGGDVLQVLSDINQNRWPV